MDSFYVKFPHAYDMWGSGASPSFIVLAGGAFSRWGYMKTKYCSCGRKYEMIPESANKNELGYWFTCECKSTLFWPLNSKTPTQKSITKVIAA
jgi:hypothetical protein